MGINKKILLFIVFMALAMAILLPVESAMAFSLMDKVIPACKDSGDCSVCDILTVLYQVAKFIFMSVSGIAMIMFLWAGSGLIMNWGSAESVAQNKKLILHTLLAIVIILLSWTLVNALGLFLGWNNGSWWQGPSC